MREVLTVGVAGVAGVAPCMAGMAGVALWRCEPLGTWTRGTRDGRSPFLFILLLLSSFSVITLFSSFILVFYSSIIPQHACPFQISWA